MRKAALILLAAVVAVSGCTTDDLATKNDLGEQTSEINEHTSEALQKDNNLVRKYSIEEIRFESRCDNLTDDGTVVELGPQRTHRDVFNRDSGIQEFQGGSYIVLNGISFTDAFGDSYDANVPDCDLSRGDYELTRFQLEKVDYVKTVYQNSSVIANKSASCRMYEDVYHLPEKDLPHYELEEAVLELGEHVYTDCLGIPVESWKPLGGENQ